MVFHPALSGSWRSRWVESVANIADGANGHFGWSAGKYYGDWKKQMGLMTTEDRKYYSISADMNKTISNEGKNLIISYTLKMEHDIGEGGAYLKLLPPGLDQEQFTSDDTYEIIFGANIVQRLSALVRFNIRKGNEYWEMNDTVRCPLDELTHMYTLIVRPDCSYEIRLDGVHQTTGRFKDNFYFLGEQFVCYLVIIFCFTPFLPLSGRGSKCYQAS